MRDLSLPRRAYRRARRRLAARALSATLLLGLVLTPFWSAPPRPAEAQSPLPAPTATRPLGAALVGTPTAGPSPTPGARPPANDPAGPPSAYTLQRSDQLFVAKTQQWPGEQGLSAFASTFTAKPDLSGLSGSTPYADTGMPASDPSGPLLPVRGRFTDPLHEQALLLSQSNDCASGPAPCTYTLLLGSPAGEGSAVAPWFWQVQGESGGSPVAVAAGDLDGRISAQGLANDEAVVAYRWADGTLRVDVIDYNAAPGEAVATAPTVALPGIGTAAAGPGSLAVAVGDFDSDGHNEIAVLWQGGGCTGTTPQCLSAPHLSMLRYSNTGSTRSLAVLRADVPLPAALMTGSPSPTMGFQTAVDDFDGQGVDLLAFSFIGEDASLAVLGFARGDPAFTVNRFGSAPGDFNLKAYCHPDSGCNAKAAGSPPQLAAGLFWYDEPSGHGLNRRQLALVALDAWESGSGGAVSAQIYDVSFDYATCAQGLCPLTLTGLLGQNPSLSGGSAKTWVLANAYLEAASFPFAPTISVATGSFQGLVLNPTDQTTLPWALAVGHSGLVSPPATFRSAVSLVRPAGAAPGAFTANSLFTVETDQVAAAPRLLAYDPAGDSLVLGAPLIYTMTGHYVPNFILQDPPKHLDWFYDPQQKHGSWLQVDRSTSLNLTVSDTQGSTYQSKNDTTTSWTIGSSVSVNVTASAEVGISGVDDAGSGLDASGTVGGQYDKNSDSYTGNSSSDTLSTSGSTFDDDLMAGTTRTWSVYRYPIIGRPLKDKDGAPVLTPDGQPQYGYYEITLPGSTVPFGPGGGIDHQDWYQPLHQNGIAFSYPPLDSTTGLVAIDPGTLGPPVPLIGSDANGTQPMQYLQQPLVNKAYTVDATGSMVSLSVTTTTSGGDTTNTTGTLSESADVDGGTYGKANFGVGAVTGCVDVDVKLNNSNSWGKLDTSSNTTTATNTFTIVQDSAAQPDWGYGAATAYYTDSAGVYRAGHGVDILQGSTDSQANWKHYYGGRPDPALNLPARMMVTYSQVDKANDIPKFSDSDSRQRIRGFFVLNPDAANGGQSGSLAAGTTAAHPVDGDTLQLQVRVHNYSLDTAVTGVPVEFWAVARDALDENNVGSPTKLGSVTLDSIPALGWVPANFLWDTSGKAPNGVQSYRIFVIVARNNPDLGSADPWNNVVHAWADRYDDPATVDGTRPGCGSSNCDRLTDPFTGQYEILEAGQNKQGWGEVTIFPKSPAPAPLAAAASRTATELRFGSGGVSVTAPRTGPGTGVGAAAASRSAAVTTDSVHEVRAHVAAAATALGNSVCHDNGNAAILQVYDGTPGQGGRLAAVKRVTGLAGAGPAGRWVTIPWTPREAGRRQLVLRLSGASMDPKATPVETTVDVDVAPAPEPPATLGRLQAVLQVVWLPADLRAALLAQVQAANTAALAGSQPAARAALTALKSQTDAARGTTVSGYSASRVGGVVDALLAQPAIAADCLPAAPAAAGTPGPGAAAQAGAGSTPAAGAGTGTAGAAGTPVAGALPTCAPGTVSGTVTPTATPTAIATGTPGTATPTPAGTPATATATATPVASGTPGTPAAGRTGTPTPPASGSPTPGAGSPTPVRTATPPPTVVPPPLAPPTVVPPPLPPESPVVPPPLAPPTAGQAAPAGPPRASDGQHLGLQPPEVQAAFRATHGDAAEARWAAEHEAALNRPTP